MSKHYMNSDRLTFERDLDDKTWVILLSEHSNGRLRGFSTLKIFTHELLGKRLSIAFSGDTIIDPKAWGSLALPIAFGNLMFEISDANPMRDLYWMLISKGFRTYRFLPVFFKEFYPRYNQSTPDWNRQLMRSLARRLYPINYDEYRGVITHSRKAQFLSPILNEPGAKKLSKDKHVSFFQKRNPSYAGGDELVCLARFSENNLNPFIARHLKRFEPISNAL